MNLIIYEMQEKGNADIMPWRDYRYGCLAASVRVFSDSIISQLLI